MRIDAIQEQKKNRERVNLYSGGEFIGALGLETALKHGIKEGVEIAEEDFAAIVNEDNERYAFDKAVHYLGYSRRTENEVKKHLIEKGLEDATAETAVEKLKGYGYIDDAAYARDFAAELMRQKNTGLRTVAFKLKQKGISQYVIEDVLSEWSGEDEAENALCLYRQLSVKYAKEEEPKKRQKIIRALMAKGFEYETIQSVMNRNTTPQ